MNTIRHSLPGLTLAILAAMFEAPVMAATIEVTPTDSFTKIEAARAGDEVVIAPGTYNYRVYLTAKAPANNPIVIRGKDPANPPIWDLSAGNVEDARGSYTAGDRGRGCWQFSGATNVHLSDVVITGCHGASHNSAGVRYYSQSTGIQLTNVLFHDNDNGLTGGTESSEITVEHCEFRQNGTLAASSSAPSHNIYIYGGTFALRYSYVHDPIQAQNFHIRAKDSTIEYNWFSRAKSYAGDLMTDDDNDGSQPSTQTMLFRGNVIVQGSTQSNTSQIIAVYNDAEVSNLTLKVNLLYNTFVGNGGHPALVHLSNADGTTMSANLSNNIIFGTSAPLLIEDAAQATVTGTNNWLMTGASATGLSNSVFGSDPGFRNAAQNDYGLAAGSTAIGAALDTVTGIPTREYYRDETVTLNYRTRTSAKDIGAFESTTQGSGESPHVPTAGAPATGTAGTTSSGGTGAAGSANGGGNTNRAGAGGTASGGATRTAAAGSNNNGGRSAVTSGGLANAGAPRSTLVAGSNSGGRAGSGPAIAVAGSNPAPTTPIGLGGAGGAQAIVAPSFGAVPGVGGTPANATTAAIAGSISVGRAGASPAVTPVTLAAGAANQGAQDSSGSGCNCRIPGRGQSSNSGALLTMCLLLGAGLSRPTRRRHRRPSR